jgi:hypothetical protein
VDWSFSGKSGRSLLAGVALLSFSVVSYPAAQPAPAGEREPAIRAAVAGEADREGLRRAFAAMTDAGYPPESFSLLLRLAADLSAAGISVDDLSSKVSEGLAKKVPPDRVMAVLAERADRLKDGRVLVLDLSSEGTAFLDQQMAFRVLADYLSRGVPSAELRRRILTRSFADFPSLENIIK